MIGLLKYGSGLPFNRLEGLQGDLGVPLPASTQWDIVEAVAASLAPAFDELIRQAAQGEVLHNDDTTVKILELMGERARQEALAGAEERTTPTSAGACSPRAWSPCATAIGSRCSSAAAGTRARTWREVLKHRAEELPPPIQMCDALSRNLPGELQTILAHCLAHARRRFVDVYDRFPEPCRHLLESLAVVYRNDADGAGASAVARGPSAVPSGSERADDASSCTIGWSGNWARSGPSPIRPSAARSATRSSTGRS